MVSSAVLKIKQLSWERLVNLSLYKKEGKTARPWDTLGTNSKKNIAKFELTKHFTSPIYQNKFFLYNVLFCQSSWNFIDVGLMVLMFIPSPRLAMKPREQCWCWTLCYKMLMIIQNRADCSLIWLWSESYLWRTNWNILQRIS